MTSHPSDTKAEWFLDVDGTRAGPYTAEQIRGLLKEGEILPHHRVTCERLGGQWIKAEELVQAIQSRGFQPPPRPNEENLTSSTQPSADGPADPTLSLFDTLKSAQERRTSTKMSPPGSREWGVELPGVRRTPAQIALLAALVATLAISAWAVTRLLSRSDPPPAPSKAEAPPAARTPPAAPTSAAPVATAPPPASAPGRPLFTSRPAVPLFKPTQPPQPPRGVPARPQVLPPSRPGAQGANPYAPPGAAGAMPARRNPYAPDAAGMNNREDDFQYDPEDEDDLDYSGADPRVDPAQTQPINPGLAPGNYPPGAAGVPPAGYPGYPAPADPAAVPDAGEPLPQMEPQDDLQR